MLNNVLVGEFATEPLARKFAQDFTLEHNTTACVYRRVGCVEATTIARWL